MSVKTIASEDMQAALGRHLSGDWGDVGREDWQENELSLKEGFRLFSVYHDRNGVKFWVITVKIVGFFSVAIGSPSFASRGPRELSDGAEPAGLIPPPGPPSGRR